MARLKFRIPWPPLRLRLPWPRRRATRDESRWGRIADDTPPTRRRRLLLVAAGATAVLILGATAWGVLKHHPSASKQPPAFDPSNGIIIPVPPRPVPAESDTGNTEIPLYNQPLVLEPAPVDGLTSNSAQGLLPKIGDDGRKPLSVYSRPFAVTDKHPRISIIVGEVGLSNAVTQGAIDVLPGEITLAFTPYTDRLQGWIDNARSHGHEVLLTLPMEPTTYPHDDPGPNTLLTSLPPERNQERLAWTLSRATGYVGLLGLTGSRFAADAESLRPILQSIKQSGLLYVEAATGPGSVAVSLATTIKLPRAISDMLIGESPAAPAINRQLAVLEEIARSEGTAVAVAIPYPVTFQCLAEWLPSLRAKGIALAPVSAVTARQPDR
ncbi:MAG: divergent polysaccharide deacetylase family protein [Azospirillaceae bacterium]|nr:divergent polysaccharide deacetylase family protein [Azospirillaceae bacterium]